MWRRSGMDHESQILELIGRVYDAALDRRLWADLSPKIARTFGGNSCVIQVQNRATEFIGAISQTSNYTAESTDAYRQYYYKHDVWVTQAATGWRYLNGDDLIEDEQFARSEMYVDFCRNLENFFMSSGQSRRSDPTGGRHTRLLPGI